MLGLFPAIEAKHKADFSRKCGDAGDFILPGLQFLFTIWVGERGCKGRRAGLY